METKRRNLIIYLSAASIFVSAISVAMFFVALFTQGAGAANGIASIYILSMLLAMPTLKVLLEKAENKSIQRIAKACYVVVFDVIFILVIMSVITLAFPGIRVENSLGRYSLIATLCSSTLFQAR